MKPEDIFNDWLDTQPLLSVNPLYNGEWYLTSTQVFDFANYYAERLKPKPKRKSVKFEKNEIVMISKGKFKGLTGKFKKYNQDVHARLTGKCTVFVTTENGDIESAEIPKRNLTKL